MEEQKIIRLADFSPEELRRWQLKLLEILVRFSEFCEKHNLRYHLSYGTCIGAVRHHGFIPWDDDVDVSMPRPDYDKLVQLWDKDPENSNFECCRTQKGSCIYFPMTLIRSNDTTCIYPFSVDMDINQGLKIDVEFLDGVPDGWFAQKKQAFFAGLFGLFTTQRVPHNGSRLKKYIAAVLLMLFNSNRIREKIYVYAEKQMSRYNYEDCDTVRYLLCHPQKKEWYQDVIYTDFEGYKMPIPVGYDAFLRDEYGDYMQFPPLEKRMPLTEVVFYDLENSYRNYKGMYYCKNK